MKSELIVRGQANPSEDQVQSPALTKSKWALVPQLPDFWCPSSVGIAGFLKHTQPVIWKVGKTIPYAAESQHNINVYRGPEA